MKTIFSRMLSMAGNLDAVDFYHVYNSSASAPYHNLTHVKFMLEDFSAVAFSGEDLFRTPSARTPSAFRAMVLAIVFHDFNHGAGTLSEEENIKQALQAYSRYHAFTQEPDRHDLVPALIQSTQYPYLSREELGVLDDDLWNLCLLIRDLDLMTWHHVFRDPITTVNQIKGLYRESRVSKPDLTLTEFLADTEKFLTSVTPNTEFGKERFSLFASGWGSILLALTT